jgi:GNAT superfamily N-acetyltransferase
MRTNKNITIKPVDRSTWADFQTLFQSRGGPSYCWCMAWRMTKEELNHNDPASRKKCIKRRVWSHTPIGLLAYDGHEAVAWCSIAPRETYQRLGGDESLEDVWSIVCFYIKREYRRKGLTAVLIENSKGYAKKHGAQYLEAYPVDIDSPSYRHMGFVKTFKKQGFHLVKGAGTRRYVMTCMLKNKRTTS